MNDNMLPVGTLLRGDTYRIERQLSSGGFGNAYVVWNQHFKVKQAMKEFFMKEINLRDGSDVTVSIPGKKVTFESQRDKFMKEAQRLWKLNNPHIVKVHDFFEENGTVYYVMDFIDGQSLSDIVNTKGPLGEKDALVIFRQLLNALSAIHGQEEPMLHLDIKPANIMLDKAGTAFLLDFGSSKQIEKDSSCYTSTAFTYTPGYAPSEVIDGNKNRIGPWSDLYELGATIYNVLTGHQPPTVSEILESREKSFSFPITISNDTRKLILWLMTPSSANRPNSVAEVLKYIGDSGTNGGTGGEDNGNITILGGPSTGGTGGNNEGNGGETVFGPDTPPTKPQKSEPPIGSIFSWKKIGIIVTAILVLAGIGYGLNELVSDGNKITAIKLDKEILTMNVGDKELLTASVEPKDAKATFIWESSDKSIVNVVSGEIVALKKGNATITVKVEEFPESRGVTCEIEVTAQNGTIETDKKGGGETDKVATTNVTVKKMDSGDGNHEGHGNSVNKKSQSLNLDYATYSGDTKNGKMDGIGVLTYKQKHVAGRDLKNGEQVCAEPGERVDGVWNNGYLSSGTLFRNNGETIKIKY